MGKGEGVIPLQDPTPAKLSVEKITLLRLNLFGKLSVTKKKKSFLQRLKMQIYLNLLGKIN